MDAVITFRATDDLRDNLRAQAKTRDVTVSQVLRDAVERNLAGDRGRGHQVASPAARSTVSGERTQ